MDSEEEHPPWAGPGVVPRWADHDQRERRRLREGLAGPADEEAPAGYERGASPPEQPVSGVRGRLAAARARRLRRTKHVWGGALVAILIIAAGTGYGLLHHPRPRALPNALVTTFLPGEFRTVPNACPAVTAATLNRYLPGKRRTVAPKSLYGRAQSLCDWSVDARPVYRVLEVTVQAYAPSGLAPGNGSATFAAKDAYRQASQQKISPPKATHLPRATVSQLSGLGTAAFAALQVPSAGGDPTNLLTVVVRDRNVLITVVSEGPARSGGGYAYVSPAQLRAAAVAAAHDILAQVR